MRCSEHVAASIKQGGAGTAACGRAAIGNVRLDDVSPVMLRSWTEESELVDKVGEERGREDVIWTKERRRGQEGAPGSVVDEAARGHSRKPAGQAEGGG